MCLQRQRRRERMQTCSRVIGNLLNRHTVRKLQHRWLTPGCVINSWRFFPQSSDVLSLHKRMMGCEGGKEGHFRELIYLMQVCLASAVKWGLIKIAICCPFGDIMLSIKHLIHWLACHRRAYWWLRGYLRWRVLWQSWVSWHQSVVLKPPRHTIHYHITAPHCWTAFRE